MKKIQFIILILVFLLTFINPVQSIISVEEKEFILDNQNLSQSSLSNKKWTFMIYGDGDFYNGWPLTDYLAGLDLFSTEYADIIVLEDVPNAPALLWHLDEENNLTLMDEPGELNMGDQQTLSDFISFSKTEFPADRYMLVLWNHGYSWKGACTDISSNNDFLTMIEIQNALHENDGVNIIGFSACRMGCIESAYQLRDETEVYFGSQEQNGCGCWPWKAITTILDISNDESSVALANEVMKEFEAFLPYFGTLNDWFMNLYNFFQYRILPYPPAMTMTAIETEKLDDVISSINAFTDVLITNHMAITEDITQARLKSEDFPRPMRYGQTFGLAVDLYHFTALLDAPKWRSSIPELHQTAHLIQQTIDEAVIDEHHQIGHRNAHGISIYFPPKHIYDYDQTYSTFGLDFTRDTQWDEFLEAYNGESPLS